ncbi:tandem-95 repeat protein, partial [Pseudoalteromonas luteoviolacea]|uniref:tandem-95 repeat protein n=1 Tax=Pseudoalteromonas luteoviolacea TaxID=43657 RepID=UPI00061CEEBA
TYRIGSNVGNGALVKQSDAVWLYTPSHNYNGADSFTFIANDGTADSSAATVNITVNAVNDAPSSGDIKGDVAEDGVFTFSVGEVATDVEDGYPQGEFKVVTQPSIGSVQYDKTTRVLTYTPFVNANGTDTFQYQLFDSEGLGTSLLNGTITITPVDDAPVASNDTIATNEDTAVSFNL